MNRPELRLDVNETEYSHASLWPAIKRWLLVLCAFGSVTLALFLESGRSIEHRQQAFEASGPFP
jgi:hypothetical protein